ncbi:hypothetical protein [Thauera sp. 2A1]|uniref:hypothetical protein n=1 Tax=Thauera sp. 2A1 TaxID=2570191 RepID=UPI001291D803|nr:hypothetical protein [Thauera sp. 2A1]KAI5913781.1 hypothetical protein GH664_16045 [Thauera sp. 2A1]
MATISKLVISAATALVAAVAAAAPAFAASDAAAFGLSVATPSGVAQRLEFRSAEGWRVVSEGGVRTVKLDLSDGANDAAAQPLAVFIDRPTGSTFVYMPEAGWQYLGRSDFGAAAQADAGAMTLFIDGPSGFVYRYVAEQGWKFAGRMGEQKL